MATINGVEIKNLKGFKGHEGEPCHQGNIYKDGKKLGFWSQDSHCGEDHWEFNRDLLVEPVLKLKSSLIDGSTTKRLYDADIFIYDLIALKEIEKHLKSALKKGLKGIYFVYDIGSSNFILQQFYTEKSISEDVKKKLRNELLQSSFETDKQKITLLEKFAFSLEDLNIVIGTEEGYWEEKTKFDQENENLQRQMEETKRETERLEKLAEDTLEEMFNSKFSFIEKDNGVLIVDKMSNKSVTVPVENVELIKDVLFKLM